MMQAMTLPLTAVSAALLALAFAWAVRLCWQRKDVVCGVGFLLAMLTATLGSLRFGGLAAVVPVHGFMAELTNWVLPTLVAFSAAPPRVALPVMSLGLLATVMGWPELLRQAVNSLSLLVILLNASRGGWLSWLPALAGITGMAMAGFGIGTKGAWAGIPRLFFYHLLLMLAVLCLSYGLHKQAEPGRR